MNPFSRTHSAFAAALLAVSLPLAMRAQQFLQPHVLPTGNWPTTYLVADLNKDGKTDFAYLATSTTNYQGATYTAYTSTELIQGAGGAFTSSTGGFGGALSSFVIATGDLFNRGAADIIFAYTTPIASTGITTQSIAIDYQVGIGAPGAGGVGEVCNFTAQGANLPVVSSIATGDFNGDGKIDLALTDSANGYLYILTNGNGSNCSGGIMTLASSIKLPDGAGPLLVGDFNHNGHVDILVNNQASDIITPYYGNGDGTFQAEYPITLPGGIFSMLVASLSGAAYPDLLVEGANGALSIFYGSVTGFASTAIPVQGAQNGLTGNGGHLIAVADLNGDGIKDILTSTPAGVSVLIASPPLNAHLPQAPNYTLGGIYNAGPGHTTFALADFNSDGHLDLAVDSPEGIAILYGNGDGSFQTSRAFAANQPAYALALGQFTGSGNLDAAVATGIPQVQLLTGDGQGNFAATAAPSPASATQTNAARTLWSHIATGDFDGDGKLDLAITQDGKQTPGSPGTSTSGTIDGLSILFGNGSGSFGSPVQAAPASGATSPHYGTSVAADFNGDGVSDLANRDLGFDAAYLGGAAATSGTMPRDVMYADTAGDASAGEQPETDAYDLITTGFFNPGRTNKQDVIVQDDDSFLVYKNNGDGTFQQVGGNDTVTGPANFFSAQGGDLLPGAGVFPGSMVLADLDGDGYGDLLVAFHNLASNPAAPSSSTPDYLYIYWGLGNGNFSAPTILTLDRNFYQVAVADIDGDGKQDLVLSDGYLVGVLYGLGNRTFGRETHFLAGWGINLVAASDINRTGATSLVIANGGPVLTNPVVTNGTLPSPNEVATGAVTVLLNQQAATTVTGNIAASPEPSTYGSPFTLTATFNAPGNGPEPTGTITFSIDGASVGTATLSNGVATLSITTTYAIGSHAIAATFPGDTHYSALTVSGTHVITGNTSNTTITNLASPIEFGQIIGANDIISTGVSATGGTITVYIDGVSVCVLPANVATSCPAGTGAGYAVGAHTIAAVFSGDTNFSGSTSPIYSVQIVPDTTSTTLGSSANPATPGESITFTAQVAAPYATPNGAVTFYDGTTLLGPGTLNAQGQATYTISTLALGTHPITAQYGATTDFDASLSSVLAQVVNSILTPEGPVPQLTSSVNPSVLGQSITFTTSVTPGFSGTVTLYDGSTVLASGAVNSQGIYLYSTSSLSLGAHIMSASFLNGNSPTGVSSAPLTQQVNPASSSGTNFTLTVTPSTFSVGAGSRIALTVTVIEDANFSEPVQLNCSSLPSEADCAFANTLIASGGGSTTLLVSPAAAHPCNSATPLFVAGNSIPRLPLLGFAALALLLARKRRRLFRALTLTLALCLLPTLQGCGSGNCTDFGVKPGTYSFTVSGVSTTTSTTQSQPMLMTVTIN
jgi:hypothetical protein